MDYALAHHENRMDIQPLQKQGMSFSNATRAASIDVAAKYNLAYYERSHGVPFGDTLIRGLIFSGVIFAGSVCHAYTSCQANAEYKSASVLLDQSTHAFDKGHYGESLSLVDQGIGVLGLRYRNQDSKFIDDTGQAESFAYDAERQGDISLAAKTKISLLRNRISLFKITHNCKDSIS